MQTLGTHYSVQEGRWNGVSRFRHREADHSKKVAMHFPRRSCRRFAVLALAFLCTVGAYLTLHSWLKPTSGRSLSWTRDSAYSLTGGLLGSRRKSEELQYHESPDLSSGQACVHPELQLWHPALTGFFREPQPLQCALQEEDWVYVTNGSFMISDTAKQRHGQILCEYIPLYRGADDFAVIKGDPVKPMKSGDKLMSDFFDVRCVGSDGSIYSNVHSGIAYAKELHERPKHQPLDKNSLGLNILMFGLDSTSRLTWMRNLPRTHDYVVNQLGAEVMEGYNIVGDGTPQALLPILTGLTETELPEARRGYGNAQTVDGHPWIWKDLVKQGYVTQWGEDGASVGTFTYRMHGFKDQPVDHYMRPFYISAEKLYYKNKPYCLGSVPRHLNMLNWMCHFNLMYPDQPKFSFLFHSEFTHHGHSEARVMDQDIKDFIWFLEAHGFLENTMLLLMADHGARFQSIRQTEQGKYEERMPYLAVRLPQAFLRKHKQIAANLKVNAHRLSTPFDLHATFHDILNFTGAGLGDVSKRGISLFQEIPKERTCGDAGVEPHWCACLQWKQVPVTDPYITRASGELVQAINAMTEMQRSVCTKLSVHNITSAVRYAPSDNVLHFKQSKDQHGRIPDLSDDMKATEVLYQVTITTKPGLARFEGTITYAVQSNRFLVSAKQISRTNKYGSQPHCVMEKLPHLRPYCYCKQQQI